MTDKNTPQPVLTDDEILQVFADAVGNQEDDARFIDVDRDQAIRIARTLLSKLRARVADPLAAFEAWSKNTNQGYDLTRMNSGKLATYESDLTEHAWRGYCHAALASAPVADTYVEARECGACGHVGINDSSDTQAACKNCNWSGDSPKEDHCPGCAQNGTMTAACPKCGSQYSLLAERTLEVASAPVAGMKPLEPEFAKVLSDNFDSLMVRIPSECAPVAPQACPTDVCQAAKADGVLCANDECDRANGVRPASAPVAGEVQPVAWRYRRASQKESMRLAGREPSEAEWHFAPHATRTTEMREGLRYNFAPSSDHVDWEPLYAAPQASEAVRDALKTCGSKVFKALAAIARAEGPDTRQADDPELIYREPVMDEAVRIRQAYDELSAALSAQPGAEPLSNPKQFALTAAENIRAGAPYDDPAFEALCREHGIWGTAEAALCAVFWRQAGQQRAAGDERAAFEATYQADYDDPGAACEREHFGKGYRAALAAQPGAQKPHPKQHNDGADLE